MHLVSAMSPKLIDRVPGIALKKTHTRMETAILLPGQEPRSALDRVDSHRVPVSALKNPDMAPALHCLRMDRAS